jgi:peptide deformylase
MKLKNNSTTKSQHGVSMMGLMFWAIVIGFSSLVGMKVLPTINEYYTIKKAVKKIATEGATTVPEVRVAFDRYKDVEYSITSISGKDLVVTKENDKVLIAFSYNKEIELIDPVFLLIKYEGSSK